MDSENFNPVSVARDDRFKALERANKELKKQLSAAKNECERLSKETKAIEVRRDDVKRYKNTVAELKKQEQDRNKRYAELTDAVKLLKKQVYRLKREKEVLKVQNLKLTNKLIKLGIKLPSTPKRKRPRIETW
jgi:archaellum component FlaC